MNDLRGLHHGPNEVEGHKKAMETPSGLLVNDSDSGCRKPSRSYGVIHLTYPRQNIIRYSKSRHETLTQINCSLVRALLRKLRVRNT
jgi:uncharacterized protein Veg